MGGMESHARLQVKRVVSAPIEVIYGAWTDPDELKRWFRFEHEYTPRFAEVDLQTGGSYRLGLVHHPEKTVHVWGGTYQDISSPYRLVFTWQMIEPERSLYPGLVTLEMAPIGETTDIILTHEPFPEKGERDQYEDRWMSCLEALDRQYARA